MSSNASYFESSDLNIQTSATESVNLTTQHHRLVFASDYNFKDEGLDYIGKKFKDQLCREGVEQSLSYIGYNCELFAFFITCDPEKSKTVWRIFYTIVTTMVKEECRESARLHRLQNKLDSSDEESSSDDDDSSFDEDLVLKSDKIGRLETCKTQAQQINTSVTMPSCSPDYFNVPDSIKHLSFKRVYAWDEMSLNIDDVFPDSVIQELSRITKCTLVKESYKGYIYIGSDADHSLQVVVLKMDNIRNHSRRWESLIYHSFYTESEANVQFSFLRLSNVKNRYFKTTLIEYLLPAISQEQLINCQTQLEKAVIVRYACFDRINATFKILWNLKITQAVKEEDKVLDLCAFKKYPARGIRRDGYESSNVSQLNASKPAPAKLRRKPTTPAQKTHPKSDKKLISSWVEGVAAQLNTLRDQEDIQFTANNRQVAQNVTKHPAKPYWNHFLENKAKELEDESQDDISLKRLRPSLKLTRNPPLQAPPGFQGVKEPRVLQEVKLPENPSDFWSRLSYKATATAPIPNPDIKQKAMKVQEHTTTHQLSSKKQQLAQNLMDDTTMNFYSDVLTPVKNKGNIPGNEKKDTLLIDLQETSRSDSCSKLGSKHLSLKPKIKDVKQKKSSPSQKKLLIGLVEEVKKPPTKPLLPLKMEPQILEKFQGDLALSFQSMMSKIQAYRGEVAIEAQFGRIITHEVLDTHMSSKGVSEKTYDEEKTRSILMESQSRFFPNFTKIITTRAAEIRYVTDMKDDNGFKYWILKENESTMHYELTFIENKTETDKRVKIEIDAQSFAIKAKTTSELANIYVHGAKRIWDFRLSATGTDNRKLLETKHSELLRMISSSLFIPENCTRPDLTFEIDDPLCEKYILKKATARHIDRYLSQDKESILNIFEVHSLEIETKNLIPKRKSTVYRASAPAEDSLQLWYEISISSKSLDAELPKHKPLEIGELIEWPKRSLEPFSLPKSIYFPACWMLEKLDGVGCYNDNGLQIGKSAPVTSEIPPSTSTARISYW